MRVLMIDNYDSFTFNLVQALRVLGAEVVTARNDDITPERAARVGADRIVISPGPGTPDAAGATLAVIEALAGRTPLLGVCLGHQAIARVFGGAATRHARALMHAKASPITHDGRGVFAGIGSPTMVGRYHSLAIGASDLGGDLIATAHAPDGEVMGLRHRTLAVEGVQFHPESVLTPRGFDMLANFLGVDAAEFTRPELGAAPSLE